MTTPGQEDRQVSAGYFPIQALTHVNADHLTNAFNDLINQINGALLGFGAGAGMVTMKQLRLAMASQANLLTYDEQVNAAVEDTINIRWNHGAASTVGDPLYLDIQSKLGLTGAQINALYALALTFPP